jgi:flavin-dependent dehydrogenase
MMLAQRGLRVCLLDRASFPSDTPSTHVIQPCGAAILRRLGLLERVLDAGAVTLERFTLVADDARIDADADTDEVGAEGLCIRRVTLDHILVQGAQEAGADVRTATAATNLLWDDGPGGRVVGVQTEGGPIRAQLVIGADGRRSSVARWVGAQDYHVAPAGRLFTWAYFEGVPNDRRLRLGRLGTTAFIACPTDGGLYLAGVCPPIAEREAFLADRERSFVDGLAGWPELRDLVAGASRVGPIWAVGNWHGYYREAAGLGWALLGDAGQFKDPTPAQGIADALRHGEKLADAIVSGLGADDLDGAVHSWWRWRDEDAWEMHWFAADLGAARSSLLATQIIHDLSKDRDAALQLLRLLNHELTPSRLFDPRRLAAALAKAMCGHPNRLGAIASEARSELRNDLSRRRARKRESVRTRSHRPQAAHPHAAVPGPAAVPP